MLSYAQETAAANATGDLRNQLDDARSQVLRAGWINFGISPALAAIVGSSEQQANLMNLLNALGASITSLETVALDRVRNGEKSFEWWVDQAAGVRQQIANAVGDTSDWTWAGVLRNTVATTASDIKAIPGQLEVPAIGVGVVLGLVAIAAIVWRFK